MPGSSAEHFWACPCLVVHSFCAMPSKSLPFSVEDAFAMDMGKFVGAIDEGYEGNTAEVVVALLEKNLIRSNRRLASTSVSPSNC